MSDFEITQQSKSFHDATPADRFELTIKGDTYWKGRAIIYGEWTAKKLAKELGIKIRYLQYSETEIPGEDKA